jgi:hypothetical protein
MGGAEVVQKWSKDLTKWSKDFGVWSKDFGVWSKDFGVWSKDCFNTGYKYSVISFYV